MVDAIDIATRILVVYESKLPFGAPATFGERMEAMRATVEDLGLKEEGTANVREIVRGHLVTP